jgi:hypothetical protein
MDCSVSCFREEGSLDSRHSALVDMAPCCLIFPTSCRCRHGWRESCEKVRRILGLDRVGYLHVTAGHEGNQEPGVRADVYLLCKMADMLEYGVHEQEVGRGERSCCFPQLAIAQSRAVWFASKEHAVSAPTTMFVDIQRAFSHLWAGLPW